MCGIFGVICASDQQVDRDLARALATSLLRFSETRGREAAGIAVHDGEQIQVFKQGGSVTVTVVDSVDRAKLLASEDHRPLYHSEN